MSLLTTSELSWISTLEVGYLLRVEQFKHARTNKVFLLTFEDGLQLVFKRLNLQARSLEKRKHELSVYKLASRHSLSAELLADCQHYRLQAYIEGETLSCNLMSHQSIDLFANQLFLIHQLPAKYALAQSLTTEIENLKKQIKTSIDETNFQQQLHLATKLDQSSTRDTLCHGDLSGNNIVQTKDGEVKILDWEYAVIACPAYDLAVCSVINEFNEKQINLLIEQYYSLNKGELPYTLEKLHQQTDLYISVFKYINKLWEKVFGYSQSNMKNIP